MRFDSAVYLQNTGDKRYASDSCSVNERARVECVIGESLTTVILRHDFAGAFDW